MYTITIKGFTSREEVLSWIQAQEIIHAAEECPFQINEETLVREKSAFKGNLNKKDFDVDLSIKKGYKQVLKDLGYDN